MNIQASCLLSVLKTMNGPLRNGRMSSGLLSRSFLRGGCRSCETTKFVAFYCGGCYRPGGVAGGFQGSLSFESQRIPSLMLSVVNPQKLSSPNNQQRQQQSRFFSTGAVVPSNSPFCSSKDFSEDCCEGSKDCCSTATARSSSIPTNGGRLCQSVDFETKEGESASLCSLTDNNAYNSNNSLELNSENNNYSHNWSHNSDIRTSDDNKTINSSCSDAPSAPSSPSVVDEQNHAQQKKFEAAEIAVNESEIIDGTANDSTDCYVLMFTCNKCGHRGGKRFSKVSV